MADLGIPDDLTDYLSKLITPFHADGEILYVSGAGNTDWGAVDDASIHAAILVGDPSSYIEELWRVLKPGAHVLAVAPEDQPTGHTGAIALEDQGFEIRDAILWVDEPGKYHYVPKPSQRERHAGCEHLKLQKKVREEVEDIPDDLEGQDLLDAVAEIEADADEPIVLHAHKGNVHPTVKPKAIMARLLEDVPKTSIVLDPFMGSGGTALACLETGHEFVGIEREKDYLEITHARVQHADRARVGDGATVESEHQPREVQAEAMDLDDFFDL
jgi:DNA modification methylase